MSFVSLFLGLVLGIQTVAVQVAAPVDRVEILLDGKSAVILDGPPWEGRIDFGQALVPHELAAVAYDRNGTELTFGGTYMDRVNSELTAIPVQLTGRRKPGAASKMQGWFVAREKLLRVAAIVKGQVDPLSHG